MEQTPARIREADVVRTAVELIDEGGLDEFSMRSVARSLGVYPATVYWHVGDRNSLLAKVLAYVLEEAPPPDAALPWRAWIEQFARAWRSALHRHPNVAPLLGELVMNVDPDFDTVAGLLHALECAGFKEQPLIDAYNAVFGGVIGFITIELARAPSIDGESWAEDARRRWEAVDDHPIIATHRELLMNRAFVARWESGDQVPLDDAFTLLVSSLLDGIELRLSGHK